MKPNGGPSEPVQITVTELVDKANAAIEKMSNNNPNKRLVWMLGSALVSLSDRYSALEAKVLELEVKLDGKAGS